MPYGGTYCNSSQSSWDVAGVLQALSVSQGWWHPIIFFWNQPAFPIDLPHPTPQFSAVFPIFFFHDTVFDFGETPMLRNHRSWFRRRAVLSLHVLLSQCCYVGLQTSSFTVLRRSKMVSAELSSPVEHQRTLQSQTIRCWRLAKFSSKMTNRKVLI